MRLFVRTQAAERRVVAVSSFAAWGERTFSLEPGEIFFIYFSHIFPGIWGYLSKFLRVTVAMVVTVEL